MADNLIQGPDTVRETANNRNSGGFILNPDPSALTATAVNQAKEDLRRELSAQRELMSERIERTETLVTNTYVRLGDELRTAVNDLERLLAQRIDGLEAILTLLDAALNNTPLERDQLRTRLQEDIRIAVSNLQELHDEKFAAVQGQFNERDIRSEQEKKASKEALDAALLAQKESVSQQNDANTTAATKSETSFTKQIDQIATLIATLEKALTDRITELKERIDRGEGQGQGQDRSNANTTDSETLRIMQLSIDASKRAALTSQVIAGIAVLVVIITAIITYAHK